MAESSNNKTLYLVLGGIAVLLVLWWLLGRGLSFMGGNMAEEMTERMIENASNGEADVEFDSRDGSFTVTTEEGTVTSGTELPSDWPDDVPVYPGADVNYAGTLNNVADGGSSSGIVFNSKDSAQKVSDFYQAELVSKGWKITTTGNSNGYIILSAEKEGRLFSFGGITADGQTTINLGISSL